MINYFRKIRQKLWSQNKVPRYLIYAIGEIVLVVIGILIALQINNWSEDQKTGNKVETLLFALRNDLIQDTILIHQYLPEVNYQLELNEALRSRVAHHDATPDTLIKVMRYEFNPNWNNVIIYNTNAYQSLSTTELIENLPDTLKSHIKNFYNQKSYLNSMVESITEDYRGKVASYVDDYTFGSTSLHDQGPLIDSLIWSEVDLRDVAAKFQGLSNFKRIVFRLTRNDLTYSLNQSRTLLDHIDTFLAE